MVIPLYFDISLDKNINVLSKKNCVYFGDFTGWEKTVVNNLFRFVMASGFFFIWVLELHFDITIYDTPLFSKNFLC